MHTALRPVGAAERIAELSRQHSLPLLGTFFSGNMRDRNAHKAILEEAELVVNQCLGDGVLQAVVSRPVQGAAVAKPQRDSPATICYNA